MDKNEPRNGADGAKTDGNVSRRDALGRFAQYTAPIVVAALMSEQAIAQSGSHHIGYRLRPVASTCKSRGFASKHDAVCFYYCFLISHQRSFGCKRFGTRMKDAVLFGLFYRRHAFEPSRARLSVASVRRFQIEDGLLLLSVDLNSLFVLNSTASYLWDLIGIRQTKENLASELSRAWEIPVSRARADVESIVAQWRLRGLLTGSERRVTVVAARAVDWHRAPSPRWTAEWICTIRGVAIAFGCENRPIVPSDNSWNIWKLRPLGQRCELSLEKRRMATPRWSVMEWNGFVQAIRLAHGGALADDPRDH